MIDTNREINSDVSQLVIRYADESDLIDMEWEGEYSHYRQLFRDIYYSSLRGDALIWLADLSCHGIVGQIFAQLRSTRKEYADGLFHAYLFGFRVRLIYQKNGIGRRLLSFAENELVDRGFQFAVLNVSKNNDYALQYYLKKGYAIDGDDPGIWSYTDQFGKQRDIVDPSWKLIKKLALT